MYSIQRGLASMERVDAILSATNPIQDPAKPEVMKRTEGEIKYRDVTFGYNPSVPVVRVYPDHTSGRDGGSLWDRRGSGKSTPRRPVALIL